MDTSGYYPQLSDDDPLFEIAQYTQITQSLLEKMPRGIIGKTVTSAAGGYVTGQSAIDAVNSLSLKAYRQYRLEYAFNVVSPSANSAVSVSFIKTATSEPGFVGTGVRGVTLWTAPAASSGKTLLMTAIYVPTADETVRFVTTGQQVVGTGGVQFSDRTLTITDMGRQITT